MSRVAAVAVLAGAGLVGVGMPAAVATPVQPHAVPAQPQTNRPDAAILRADSAIAVPLAGPADLLPSAGAISGETEGLDPLLAAAYSAAEAEAHEQGVPLSITSGYRTYGEQQWLWEDGIRTHGGPDAARRWVLPPEESTHVSGQAVDVGPREGAQWLEANGSRWGLCRTYDNEWWHFEMATLPGMPCPPLLPDASAR